MAQYKITTTTEQIVTTDEISGLSTVESTITSTNIVMINNKVINAGRIQLVPAEVKYGYLAFRKDNPIRNMFSPGKTVNFAINLLPSGSITGKAKTHSVQKRIDGLVPIFSQIKHLEARVFNLTYDPTTDTVTLDEV